jgi:hypothetical protein
VLYVKAAEAGDVDGMIEAARCLFYGIGTRRDRSAAAMWSLAAARKGNSEAQYAAGLAYERGEGLRQSRARARIWYAKAAAQGHVDAARSLAELSS